MRNTKYKSQWFSNTLARMLFARVEDLLSSENIPDSQLRKEQQLINAMRIFLLESGTLPPFDVQRANEISFLRAMRSNESPLSLGDDDGSGDSVGETTCCICMDNPACATIFPCNHSTFCFPCILKIREENGQCPLCRGFIERIDLD